MDTVRVPTCLAAKRGANNVESHRSCSRVMTPASVMPGSAHAQLLCKTSRTRRSRTIRQSLHSSGFSRHVRVFQGLRHNYFEVQEGERGIERTEGDGKLQRHLREDEWPYRSTLR